jgi:hypothetical protein
VIKLELLLGVTFALWVFCLVDVIGSSDSRVRNLPKIGWLIPVLLFPWSARSRGWSPAARPVGATTFATRARGARLPGVRPARAGRGRRPREGRGVLWQVRAGAEEQRRRYEQSKQETTSPVPRPNPPA